MQKDSIKIYFKYNKPKVISLKLLAFVYLFIIAMFLTPSLYAKQQNTLKKYLSLADAVDIALTNNFLQKARKHQLKIFQINFSDQKDKFWLPNIKLDLNITPYSLLQLSSGHSSTTQLSNVPTSSLSLNFGEYTLFNWGIDYLQFENDKQTFTRNTQVLSEQERDLKHQVILAYFDLVEKYKIVLSYKFMYDQSSFIFRLSKERAMRKQISREEFYELKNLYLAAKENYYLAKKNLLDSNFVLTQLMSFSESREIRPVNDVKIIAVTYNARDLIKIAKKNNPNILTANLNNNTAKRDYLIAKRKNIPLPKITLRLGAYKYLTGPQLNRTIYSNLDNSGNLDMVASINASWALTGAGGFANQNSIQVSHLKKLISQMNLKDAKIQTINNVKKLYYNIKYLKSLIDLAILNIKNNQSKYDTLFDLFTRGKSTYFYYKDALVELVDSTNQRARWITAYVKAKLQLAKEMGVMNLLNENFIKDTIKIQEKI